MKINRERLKSQLEMFFIFLKIGAFTFGGGYAMIPLIQKEICEKRNWISSDDLLEIIAISESTPGPIAVNAATFIGNKKFGFGGSFFATLGVTIPSFVIICLVSLVLSQFESLVLVQYAFFGVRAGVLALIVTALTSMFRKSSKNAVSYVIASAAFVCVGIFGVNAFIVLIGCALLGLASYKIAAETRSK